jgi:hypothetical protein
MSLFDHFNTSSNSPSQKFNLDRIQFEFPAEITTIESIKLLIFVANNFLVVAVSNQSCNSILRIDLEKIDAVEGAKL